MKKPMRKMVVEAIAPPPKKKRERIPPSASMSIPRGTMGSQKKK